MSDLSRMNETQLKKARNRALEKAQEAVEDAKKEGRPLTRSERREYDRHMDRAKEIKKEIEKLGPAREPIAREAFEGSNETGPAIHTGGRDMGNDYDERGAVDRYIRTGEVADESLRPQSEVRAADQSIGTPAEGGVLASTGFSAELFDVMQAHGGVRNTRATIIETDHGRDFNRPGVDDVDAQAEIVTEGSTISSVDNVDFFDVQFTSHTYQAGPITLTREQIADSQLDVVEILRDKLGQRIARATAADYAGSTATSSTAPNGLITASSGPVTIGAGSSNLGLQTLRDLFFSVDPVWRGEAEWSMSDAALQAVADIEDADGRPLVEPSVQTDFSGELFGRPIQVVNELDDLSASTNFPILFGDHSAFGIRDVTEIQVQRLDELFARNRRVGFMAWFRTDSRPMWSSTISSSNVPIQALRTT